MILKDADALKLLVASKNKLSVSMKHEQGTVNKQRIQFGKRVPVHNLFLI